MLMFLGFQFCKPVILLNINPQKLLLMISLLKIILDNFRTLLCHMQSGQVK